MNLILFVHLKVNVIFNALVNLSLSHFCTCIYALIIRYSLRTFATVESSIEASIEEREKKRKGERTFRIPLTLVVRPKKKVSYLLLGHLCNELPSDSYRA